jgi:hypothetical protein
MTPHQKALASIIEADPYPRGGPLQLVYFGVVTAELDPVVFHLGQQIASEDLAGEAWFDDYVAKALEMGGMLAVQKFAVSPAGFPGRLAVLMDGPPPFIPVMQVADRLITWGNKAKRFCATDKPTRAVEIRAAIMSAEGKRMGAALQ